MNCFIMLFPLMSVDFSFALFVFNSDSSFWNIPVFPRKRHFSWKSICNQNWSLSNVPFWRAGNMGNSYCVKSVCIWSYSSPFFLHSEWISSCSVRIRENTNQNNFKYEHGHFSRSNCLQKTVKIGSFPELVNSKF